MQMPCCDAMAAPKKGTCHLRWYVVTGRVQVPGLQQTQYSAARRIERERERARARTREREREREREHRRVDGKRCCD